MSTSTARMSFRISGQHLTDLAREKALEDDYIGALAVLGGLEGITLEQSNAVIQGTLRLTGVNTFELEPEDAAVAESWAEEWAYQVEGVYFDTGRHKYFRILACRNINDPGPCQWEADLLVSTWRLKCSIQSIYNKYTPLQLAETTANLYFPGEGATYSTAVSSDGQVYSVYVKEVDKKTILPWNQSALRNRSVNLQHLLDERVVADLRTLELRMKHCPELEDFYYSHGGRLTVEEQAAYKARVLQEPQPEALCAEVPPRDPEPEVDVTPEIEPELEDLRNKIQAFAVNDAEYGWLVVPYVDKLGHPQQLRLPKRAMAKVAYNRARLYDRVTYSPFSPSDLKMGNDDQAHTDAWLMTGFPLDKAYDNDFPATAAFYQALFDYQRELLSLRDFVILNRGHADNFIYGPVLTAESVADYVKSKKKEPYVLLVPHAGIEFDQVARGACAIITAAGGKLAHLVTVSRERDIPIIRVDNAMTVVPKNRQAYIELDKGLLSFASSPGVF